MPHLPDSGFDKVAPFYDKLASLVYGSSLKQTQLYLLPFIPNKAKVLLIGGGSGWLLEQLLKTGKELDILYLDASPAMLARAKVKYTQAFFSHCCKVEFRLGTEATLLPHEQFNVIITPYLLDLFPPLRLQQLMQRLNMALAPNGLWLFADFWPVQQHARWWQKVLVWGMYTFFGKVSGVEARTLPDYEYHFGQLGLKEVNSSRFYAGFVQAKVYQRE